MTTRSTNPQPPLTCVSTMRSLDACGNLGRHSFHNSSLRWAGCCFHVNCHKKTSSITPTSNIQAHISFHIKPPTSPSSFSNINWIIGYLQNVSDIIIVALVHRYTFCLFNIITQFCFAVRICLFFLSLPWKILPPLAASCLGFPNQPLPALI